ncbi:dTDP-3-amino-3,4,6-trideoxy-alpha-D-glucose transaminase [subsurface metagenome]
MRRSNTKKFSELLSNMDGIITPYEADYAKHVYHLYVIKTENRDKLREKLKSEGVATGIHYPIPLHLQPAYNYLGYKRGDFPVTEECSQKILSLPMFAELTNRQIEEIVELIKDYFKK